MINIKDKSGCTGCAACAASCPVRCIRMIKDEEGFLYPHVDEQVCVQCGRCKKVCPLITKDPSNDYAQAKAYAAYSKDAAIRESSSSGGVFSELATQVIQQGGVVIGAAFNKDFSVSHMCAQTPEDVLALRGSKYVQSEIGNAYVTAKEHLNRGQMVLFTGTPCQIAGLYRFLGGDHEHLITQDIVCHGVPSPSLWQSYLSRRKEENGSDRIARVQFRDKATGWRQYSLSITFENETRYSSPAAQDRMMKAFLKNLCLRPSCYECAFKQLIKCSDITLADFWGAEHIVPDMDDNKGISLVMLNSPKGEAFFMNLRPRVVMREVERTDAVRYNLSAVRAASLPKERDAFMKLALRKGFQAVANKYLKTSFFKKMRNKIKCLLHR